MKYFLLLFALAASACDREPERRAVPSPAAAEPVVPTAARQSQPPKVIPQPKDQSELDRLILAGYTPHAGHLHPPGVKSCPLAKGEEAIM